MIVVYGEHDDMSAWHDRFDGADPVNTVHPRQPDVAKNHARGRLALERLESVFTGRKCPSAVEMLDLVDLPRDHVAKVRVVLDQPDRNFFCCRCHFTISSLKTTLWCHARAGFRYSTHR